MPFFEYRTHRIHFRDEGQGPLLVLLPGNTASSAVHGAEVAHFGRRFRVVCPDYLGYGLSDRLPRLPLDFWWENAQMVAQLLAGLGALSCAVVGTSGGSLVGLSLAVLLPRVVNCVVADSCPGEVVTPEQARRLVSQRDMADPAMVRFWRHAHGDDWEAVVRADGALLIDTFAAGNLPCHGRLGEIRCPVLFTAGLSDELIENVEAAVSGAARQITGSQVFLSQGGTHPFMWSRPAEFRRQAGRFIRRSMRRRTA